MRHLTFHTLLVAALACTSPLRAQTSCAPQWSTGFILPSPEKSVNAALQWFHGSEPALFIGGDFNVIEGQTARGIARWTESEGWNNLGFGLAGVFNVPHHAQCFAVYDDGTGPALYMGGQFRSVHLVPALNIVRWNDWAWSALGAGLHYTQDSFDFVYALAVYDDGSGSKLYAGGRFTDSGGVPMSNIARWDGTSWSPVGGGISGNPGDAVYALAVYDDGSGAGPMLYAGGAFSLAGGQATPNLARWDGTNWSAAGAGADHVVRALRVLDFGSGPRLYAAGTFTWLGVPANGVASFDGQQWSAVGNGVTNGAACLASFDAGFGPELYAGSAASPTLTKLVGQNFVSVTGGPSAGNNVVLCEPYDLGTGKELFVGGDFQRLSPGVLSSGVTYDGSRWRGSSAVRGGLNQFGQLAVARAFQTVHHGGAVGTRNYVGGRFDTAGGVVATGIAGFDGGHWSPIGDLAGSLTTSTTEAFALCEFDFGSGPELVVGGSYTSAGGVAASGTARFDGVAWHALSTVDFEARVFEIHDDGSGAGPALYGAGVLFGPGGSSFAVARFDGANWVALGASSTDLATALKSFDDGSGSKLYAVFGAQSAFDRVHRWDGATWTSFGAGLGSNEYAASLEVFDDGSGARLYAGMWSSQVWRWNGAAWQFRFNVSGTVTAMRAHDDGTGSQLFVACRNGANPKGLMRWNGISVAPVGNGTHGDVLAIGVLEEPTGPALHIGGDQLNHVYESSGNGVPSVRIARWAPPCPSSGVTFCAGAGSAGGCPCGNAGAVGRGCANSANSSGARLSASGVARLTQDTARLAGEGMPTIAPVLYFQGTATTSAIVFGDGLKCTGGALVRLGIVFNSNGASQYPAAIGTLASSGFVFAPGTRHYQAHYRDSVAFCSADTFNLTNGVTLDWIP